MQTVLITGGTGLLGSRVSHLLKNKGYRIIHLSRKRNENATFPAYKWDIGDQYIEEGIIEQADYIVHLAGAGIADGRWTASRKQLIIDSRVDSTNLIKAYLEKTGHRPKAIIAAAAIGYYGDSGKDWVTEETPPGKKGFLSKSCIAWENALHTLDEIDTRNVRLRIGLVLSTKGGALEKMLPTYQVNTGTYFGDGSQYYSWIHIEDMARIIIAGIENKKMTGTYNAVAPNPVTNKQLAKDIGTAMDKTILLLPAPSFGLRLALGEMADAVLTGSRVSVEKLLHTGFEFNFKNVVPALKDLLERKI